MSKHLMTDIGENLEYVKTIVSNTMELKKIEAAESASKIIGKGVVAMIVGTLSLFIVSMLLILCTLLIAQSIGSLSSALLIMSGCLLVLIMTIYLLRNILIIRPITKVIYSTILTK